MCDPEELDEAEGFDHVPIEIRNARSDGFVRGFKQAIQAVLQVRARLMGLLGLPIV